MIACRPCRCIYRREETGYTVMLYKTGDAIPPEAVCDYADGMACFKAAGMQLPDTEELLVELDGEWKEKKYGWQLEVDGYDVFLPKTRDGIIGYLSSTLVKGVGPVTAVRIADMFGEDTFRVMQEEPERLLEVKGITPAKLEEIKESFAQSSCLRELMAYLAPYKVTPVKVQKIQDRFGIRAAAVLKENPYRLTEIPGMGFLTVDPIARRMGNIADDAPARLYAAVNHVLKTAETEGHLFLSSGEIVLRAAAMFQKLGTAVGEAEIRRAGNRMVKEGSLMAEGSCIYLKDNLLDEQDAAYHILRLLKGVCPPVDVESELVRAQEKDGIWLGEKQKDAVRNVFGSPVSIITGGPGRGKTMVLRTILRIFKAVFPEIDILLCAPTGRAARRMMESTGHAAMTIHKALYLTEEEPENGVAETELVQEDLVVVDETTMVDMHLASTLFSRLKDGCRLILVGDADQLPSVGPGNVFRDLIGSGIIPVTVLDVSYRQLEGSLITANAGLINDGRTGLSFGREFSFVHADSPEDAAREVLAACREMAGRMGDADAVQVLSPVKKQPWVGVEALNGALQEMLNPDRGGLKIVRAGCEFRRGDRVMQTKNRDEITNGDIGEVEDIRLSEENKPQMAVRFTDGRCATYREEDMDILTHAYAITVHKAQGSEYPAVIMPVLPSFYRMLKRNVLYTAVTRASRAVCLVGSTASLVQAIHKNDVGRRNTKLAERICAMAGQPLCSPAA